MSVVGLIAISAVVDWKGIHSANAQAAQAQPPACYTTASLQGSYAVVDTYGANAAIGLEKRYFDGAGNMTGTVTINGPTTGSPTGVRAIVTAKNIGTYFVNCDGTGTIFRTFTYSSGATFSQTDDFVITGAVMQGSENSLATALADAQRTPSDIVAGGIFLTRSYTRVP